MAAYRRCLDCPRIIPSTAYKGRCSTCKRARDQRRGTRAERGYDRDYDRIRRAYQRRMDAGEAFTCWDCGEPIDPNDWHLGHDPLDRSIIRGPQRTFCNLSDAGRNSHMS